MFLVDEWLELPKYKRIGEDIEQTIIEYFADGKRYHDICAICKKSGISVSTVHRIFKNLEIIEANPVKVKLEKNQPIFCSNWWWSSKILKGFSPFMYYF
ncbi:helix-turn-helix domain-containing protein [Spiroplasma ixodetis]|uniref:helix-turn-helix domain-containing protein n=1 Tax=Spiroplasma ixodetis TaxID=2141 RepID=UPI002575F39D|nr:helix-turn-helix domain-containing protein [Spiroplasma ixodetis]WJG70327.1 hypothetical protein SIXOD_v1c14340 [Spiroplasma ixodetis Y32]